MSIFKVDFCMFFPIGLVYTEDAKKATLMRDKSCLHKKILKSRENYYEKIVECLDG